MLVIFVGEIGHKHTVTTYIPLHYLYESIRLIYLIIITTNSVKPRNCVCV